MRHFRVGAMAFAGLCLLALPAVGQDAASIEGAWKVVKVEKLGPDGWVAEDLQPGLLIFAAGYYSNMFVPTDRDGKSEPRKLFPDRHNITDAQKAEAWDTVRANSGSYKLSGSQLTFTFIVANHPNLMDEGHSRKVSFKVEGDTLTLQRPIASGAPLKATLKRLK